MQTLLKNGKTKEKIKSDMHMDSKSIVKIYKKNIRNKKHVPDSLKPKKLQCPKTIVGRVLF